MTKLLHYLRFLTLFGLLWSLGSDPAWAQEPKAELGTWDLSWHDPSASHRPFRLDGSWEFYWHTLLEPTQPLPPLSAYARIGYFWNYVRFADGSHPPSFGYATYRIRVRGFQSSPNGYEIRVLGAQDAARLIVFPEQHPEQFIEARSGRVGTSPDTELPSTEYIHVQFLPKPEETWVVLIQVSNFNYASGGGARFPVLIAAGNKASTFVQLTEKFSVFSLGITFAVGLYCLLLFLRLPNEKAALWLAFLCLSFLIQKGTAISDLQDTSWYHAYIKIRWMGTLSIFFCYQRFLNASLPSASFPRLSRVVWLLNGSIAALILFLPNHQLTWFRDAFMLAVMPQTLLMAVQTLRALKQKVEGAIPISLGFFASLIGIIHDLLMYFNAFSYSFEWFIFAFSIGVLIQNKSLVRRTSAAHLKAARFAQQMLDQESARTRFFHNISHELRNPLNGILGFLQLVVETSADCLDLTQRQHLEKAKHLTLGLKRQLNTILELAQIRGGNPEFRIHIVDLERLHNDVETLAEGLCINRNGLNFHSQWKWADDARPFIGDADKVGAILQNLITNACKFTDPHRTNNISLRVTQKDWGLDIEIKDQGIGISSENHQRIFEHFVQVADPTQKRFEGSGLGLPLVREFLQLMRGSIQVESEPGRGSCFRLQIPSCTQEQISPVPITNGEIYQETLSDVQTIAAHIPRSSPRTLDIGRERGKILVIDDHRLNVQLMVAQLQTRSYSVRCAYSGAEGLALMQEETPDVVLLDLIMPEMSGEELLKRMRHDPNLEDIPVILITGRASDEERIEGLSLGADDYLTKPILPAELLYRVDNMLRRHQLLLQVQQLEAQSKFIQLGEMLQDLSHEMKNILNTASQTEVIREKDIAMALAAVSLEEQHRDLLIAGLLARRPHPEALDRMNLLPLESTSEHLKIKRSLRLILAECEMSESQLADLWTAILQRPSEEILYLHNQLHLIQQYQTIVQAMKRCRELTSSILSLTRSQDSHAHCSLRTAWEQVQSMLQPRLRKHRIHLSSEVEDIEVPMAPHALLQILLNLLLNAIDAVQKLDPSQRWIEAYSEEHGSRLKFFISNAGPEIPAAIAEHMFERGFTTKGSKGSGVGLFIARRLARSAQGELSLDLSSSQPRFCLTFPHAASPRSDLDIPDKAS